MAENEGEMLAGVASARPEVVAVAKQMTAGKLVDGELTTTAHQLLLQWLKARGTAAAASFKNGDGRQLRAPQAGRPDAAAASGEA